MNDNDHIIAGTTVLVVPFTVLFGLYLVVGGANSPGGGFQGGAVLSALFIQRWIIMPGDFTRINMLFVLEKALMAGLLLFAMLLFARDMLWGESPGAYYMLALNFLIALKVGCGLGIIFFRFILHESR